jgi:uncharacterized protein YjbI with pentapeptide repeats
MANPEHLAKLKKGTKAWNKWRENHPQVTPELTDASLIGIELTNVNLERANLVGADLRSSCLIGARLDRAIVSRADLTEANLKDAQLIGAYFTESILVRADLSYSNLARADLTGADLACANLFRANLTDAKLVRARLCWANLIEAILQMSDMSMAEIGTTSFGGSNISSVKGLGVIEHLAPSTIGIDTIYLSQGKISEVFLRGCGVPDEFITFAKSLVTNPIEFYSCFISYSTKDQAFADRLYADLQNKGVRCWFAPHDVQGGRKLHEQIDEAIRLYDKLLLILSPHSMESEWVKTEIAKARKREVCDKRRVLFPIRLAPFETLRHWECFDADSGKDSAREIREYFIPDFSNWKDHDSYQEAFQRLISDLKASDARPPVTQPTHPK